MPKTLKLIGSQLIVISFSDFNPCQQNVTLGFVGQALKQVKVDEAVRGAWGGRN